MAMLKRHRDSQLLWDNGLVMRASAGTWRLNALDAARPDAARVTDAEWRGPRVTMRLGEGGHSQTPRLKLHVGRELAWRTNNQFSLDGLATSAEDYRPSPLFQYALPLSISRHALLRDLCGRQRDVLPWLRFMSLAPDLVASLMEGHRNLARLCASRLSELEPALLAYRGTTPKHRQLTAWLGLSNAPWVGRVIQKLDLRDATSHQLSRVVVALTACVANKERAKMLKHANLLCAESVLALTHISPWLSLDFRFLNDIALLDGPTRRQIVSQDLPIIAAAARVAGKPERVVSLWDLLERSVHGWEHQLDRRAKRRLLAQTQALPADAACRLPGSTRQLTTVKALKEEGARMRHCLGLNEHIVNLYHGTSRFYAIDVPERCTLEVHVDRHGLPHLRAAHGPKNHKIAPQTRDLIERWLGDLRQARRGEVDVKRLRELETAKMQVEPWFNALLRLPALRSLSLDVAPSHASVFPWTLGPHHIRRVDCMSSKLSDLSLRAPAIAYDSKAERLRIARIAKDMTVSIGLSGEDSDVEDDDQLPLFDDDGPKAGLGLAAMGLNFVLDRGGRRVSPRDAASCSDAQVAGLFAVLNRFDPDLDLTVNLAGCVNLVGAFWEEVWKRRPWSLDLSGCVNLDARRISAEATRQLRQATLEAELRRSSRAKLECCDCPGLDARTLERLVCSGGVSSLSVSDGLAAEPSALSSLLRSAAEHDCAVDLTGQRFATEPLDFCEGSQFGMFLHDVTLDERAMARIAGAAQRLFLWDVVVPADAWRHLIDSAVTHLYVHHYDSSPSATQLMAIAQCRQLEDLVIEAHSR